MHMTLSELIRRKDLIILLKAIEMLIEKICEKTIIFFKIFFTIEKIKTFEKKKTNFNKSFDKDSKLKCFV